MRFIRGTARTLGGDGPRLQAAQTSALHRMQNWVYMCQETVMAEFPDFDVIGAFEIFNGLSPTGGGGVTPPTISRSLCRLAKTFKVDPDGLKAEYEDLRGIAASVQRKTGCLNRQAWKHAYDRTQARAESRRAHPIVNLQEARLGMGCQVSGVRHQRHKSFPGISANGFFRHRLT